MASNWADFVDTYGRPASNASSEDFESFLLGRGLKKPHFPSWDERQEGDLINLYQWYVDNGVSEFRAAYWVIEQDKNSKNKPKFVPHDWLFKVNACKFGHGKCVPRVVKEWSKKDGMDYREALASLDAYIDEFEDEREIEAQTQGVWRPTKPEPARRWLRWAIIAAIIVVVIVIVVVAVVFTKDKYTPRRPRLAAPSIPPMIPPPPMSTMPPPPMLRLRRIEH